MSLRIVVIDDDPDILAMLGEVLRTAGYEAVLYPRVIDDLAEVVALTPQAMLVDLMIGHAPDGAQLLGHLLSEPSTAPIPLIACTAFPRRADHHGVFG